MAGAHGAGELAGAAAVAPEATGACAAFDGAANWATGAATNSDGSSAPPTTATKTLSSEA